jgi:hypothetical protein
VKVGHGLREAGSRGAANSGAIDPDLALVVEVWPALSASARAAVVALVERAAR